MSWLADVGIVLVWLSILLLLVLGSKKVDVIGDKKERSVVIDGLVDIDDCCSYEAEMDVSILVVGSIDERRLYDEVVSVTAGKVINWLLVVGSDVDVSDKTVEVKSLVIFIEECVNIDVSVVTWVVSDRIDGSVDTGLEISIVDVIKFEVSS